MFEKDNYHWTQDDYTEEGLDIIRNYLGKEDILLENETSSIYVAQRMGKYHTRLDLSVTLSRGEDVLSVNGYAGIEEDEIEESPLKKPFIEAVKKMKEEIVKIRQNTSERKSEPEKEKKEKKEKKDLLSRTVRFTGPKDRIESILFKPGLLQACNPSIIMGDHPFTIKHPAMKMEETEKSENKMEKSFSVEIDKKIFSVKMVLQTRGEGTALKISSKDIPASIQDKFISYLENIILRPVHSSLHIPYTIE